MSTDRPRPELSGWVDDRVRPQDDLYTHVNGRWLESAEIPPDRAQHGTLLALCDEVEADVRAIVEDLAGADATGTDTGTDADADAARIGDLYRSFMDVGRVEALGTGPVRPLLDEIDAAPDPAALAHVLGARQRETLAVLFGVAVAPDARDSTRYLPHLSQAGLGLPDGSYYRDERHAMIRDGYRDHLARIGALAGLPDPAGRASAALTLEVELAAVSADPVSSRDAEQAYTLVTWDELRERGAGFDWSAWLAGLGTPAETFTESVLAHPEFLSAAARLWRELPLEQWQAWLSLRVLSACAPYLGEDFVQAGFAFHGRALSGTPRLADRPRRALAVVDAALGDAVGRRYVERHFPPRARERAVALVDSIVEAYRRSLTDLDWMGPETRRRALDKLGRLRAKVGHPDRWHDHSGLDIRADDLLGNVRRSAAWHTARELRKVGAPVDRDEWLTTPHTVNAFYNPRLNEIVLPAAVLRPPLFDPDGDAAADHGGIGSTIGHEIGHGFDDQGSKYDGAGNLVDWWAPEDRERYTERTRALVEQYDALTPAGLGAEHTVNGELTLGENIGDLGGLAIALRAYDLACTDSDGGDGGDGGDGDGLTGTQRVFFAWARTWCAVTRDAEAIRRLAVDPHAPPDLRCNAVVTNLDAFHDAFGVTEQDALFTPEADRVRIW